MENNNNLLDSKNSHMEVQKQKKMGFQDGDDLGIDFTSLETERKMAACEKKSGNCVEEMIREENMKENGVLEDLSDMAPVDEVCPICFDKFSIPCRTNCGHWFCAGCIMQFWMYRSSIQQCKCPLCCCIINNLAPETSQNVLLTDDVVEVLKKVRQYNGLSTGGMRGLFLKVLALPLLMSRIGRISPNGVRCIYYVMRLLGLLLAFLYEMGEYEFIPTGGFGIQRAFDTGASVFSGALLFVGIVYRCVLRCRAEASVCATRWAYVVVKSLVFLELHRLVIVAIFDPIIIFKGTLIFFSLSKGFLEAYLTIGSYRALCTVDPLRST